MADQIQEGFAVFLHDGDKMVGAVRRIHAHGIAIYVENAGDFEIPQSAIKDIHDGKVVLDAAKLESRICDAIRKAHVRERPGYPEDTQ